MRWVSSRRLTLVPTLSFASKISPASLRPIVFSRRARATALHLDARPDVVQCIVKDRNRVRAGPLLDKREGVVDDLLRRALLTVEHDLIDQLLHQHAPMHGIGRYPSLRRRSSPGHLLS